MKESEYCDKQFELLKFKLNETELMIALSIRALKKVKRELENEIAVAQAENIINGRSK